MADVLAEIGGVKLTFRTAGILTSALVLILFTILRIRMNPKTSAETRRLTGWLDGIGFGLLPALSVWKIFEALRSGAGGDVTEPLPLIPGLTENGRFLPESIEAAAALLCFAGVCVWLMIRKDELRETGDLLMVSACLWSAVRIVTESFREVPDNVIRYVYCALILACLTVWTARQAGRFHAKQRTAGNWIAAALCTAMIALTASGTLTVGSAIGDLAVIAGCSALMTLLTLLCGGDQRDRG